ncbi:MAG TPA: hypothetical protein VJY35_07660 [Candidatus Eisenbacteria bacterium]|nr:hypothetical protein [Candidatus Eisenbacteria bacterium]
MKSTAIRTASLVGVLIGSVGILSSTSAWATGYPPPASPPTGINRPANPNAITGLIFTNTHSYAYNANPAAVVIKVEVFDNFAGDFTKYHWVYTVTNNGYDPNPPQTNGFSGFETALPAPVPDLGDVSAPDGIPPWIINTYSGLPVEWDLPNTPGAPVGGGTLPGQTEVYSFTSSPRLITVSTGWFHTWLNDGQAIIVNYPEGDGPEVPDVLAPPNQELCCHQGPAGYLCEVLPAGQCAAIGGVIVVNCEQCPPNTPVKRNTWGSVKRGYR